MFSTIKSFLLALMNISQQTFCLNTRMFQGNLCFLLAMKVGRVKMFPNKGDRRQITVKMNYSVTLLWVTAHTVCRNQPQIALLA